MDTHGNRALFSRAMVKVAACAMLTAGLPQAMLAETGNAEAAVMAAQQTRTVNGQVVDSNGESIIGANIVEKGNNANGTITDFDGKFTLKVAPGNRHRLWNAAQGRRDQCHIFSQSRRLYGG